MRLFWVFICCLFPLLATAQEDDKGFLTNYLQDALSGAGRTILIDGFEGALSSEASLARMTIADEDGVWLILEDAILDWNRSALLRGRVEVEKLTAQKLTIERLPKTKGGVTAEAKPFSLPELPVSVRIEEFAVNTIHLGDSILGSPVELTIMADMLLSDGSGTINLNANRTDGQDGTLTLAGEFDRETSELTMDLRLQEATGGIAARVLNLPGKPSVDLTLSGSGPLDDFTANLALATDDAPRLSGVLTLVADPTTQGRAFEAGVEGDITALFLPKYQDFFGPSVALEVSGRRYLNGAIDLDTLSLNAQALSLSGAAKLDQDGWPSFMDINGTLRAKENSAVLLPFGETETYVDNATLKLRHDREVSENIRAEIDVFGLDRAELQTEHLRLALIGQINQANRVVSGLTARVGMNASGVVLSDVAQSQALGSLVQGGFDVAYVVGNPIEISELDMAGADYGVTGQAQIQGLDEGFKTALAIALNAQNLSRFSALANRPLEGQTEVTIDGTLTPLNGAFDLTVLGGVTDLQIDQAQADRLLRGRTSLQLEARRNETGTTIRSLTVSNPAMSLQADGQLTSDQSRLSYTATLNDVSLVAPGLNGPLRVQGTANGSALGWRIATDAQGPFNARASVNGLVTGPNAQVSYTALLPNIRALVPEVSGPLRLDGTAQRQGAAWVIDTDARGPEGTTATIAGRVDNAQNLNIRMNGRAPLGLANPFLSPRNIQGISQFDLTLRGPAKLSSLSGQIAAQNARITAPNFGLAIGGLNATITLSGAQAQVQARGDVSSGGQIALSGQVGLQGRLPADLRMDLIDVQLSDPDLYQTSVSGQVRLSGPALGGGQIAGALQLGQTDISVPSSTLSTLGPLPDVVHIGAPAPVRRTLAYAGLNVRNFETARQGPEYRLNVTLDAPRRIFVRGRGLDAELGGSLQLAGTTQNVISTGRFELIRGRLDILQQRFRLDEGVIQLQGGFVPFIRFVATTQTQTGTASVIVSGRASEPRVTFQATPDAPEDEILAQLLFGRNLTEISAFQALQLASAAATLAGRGGEGLVGGLRNAFGLDDFDITTSETGETGLRVGKYLSENVYTDVTVGSEGTANVTINLDITPNLTARGRLGSDGDTALGIFFEKDY